MPRLLFEKTGNAIWISHLDLMRLFQRAFKRAGLPLTHTKGFNPRPSVSIALPLSVGIESQCELLDFDLDGEPIPNEDILTRLNEKLVEGISVKEVYSEADKIKNLAYLDCRLSLEYDNGVDEAAVSKLQELFSQPELMVEKKSKNGTADQNIIPMIRTLEFAQADANTLFINARICCQNPSLNPMQIPAAITRYLPECAPDFVRCRRMEVYTNQETIFR